MLDNDLAYEILSAVSEIPKGRVATYGQIAALIGRERNARLVGRVLSVAEYYGDYPLPPRCKRRRQNRAAFLGTARPA